VEGYLRTDDRMRLAKERREERERSLAAREQLIREKERRARLQYERTVEERWRRLEEQRQKEELRRAAVEEKRRQQLEEERERLEALMRRSMERSLQLEQRNKRWSRGYPTGAGKNFPIGESENVPLPYSATSAFPHGIAYPLPAVSESGKVKPPLLPPQMCLPVCPTTEPDVSTKDSCPLPVISESDEAPISPFKKSLVCYPSAPCSPHRSPFCSSLNPADHSRVGLHQGGSQSTPNTPKKERLRRERRTASPGCGSPVRRSESPASVSKHLESTSKLGSKLRCQSPGNTHYSPTRYPAKYSSSDRRAEEKTVEREAKQMTEKKGTNNNIMHPASRADTNAELNKSGSSKEPAPGTVKPAAGTTNAEEATRLLTERRRQARAQKELEEKKRELEEERRDNLKQKVFFKCIVHRRRRDEQQRKQISQEQQLQEAKAREEKELARQNQENKQKEQQTQLEKERERAKLMARETEERLRQNREIQKQQEEEERQLRKKRLEEIMRRTRKGEADLKVLYISIQPMPQFQPAFFSPCKVKTQVNNRMMIKVLQRKCDVNSTERRAVKGSQVDGKPVGTHLAIGHMSTPIIRLEPLGVKDSRDDMQSMEISITAQLQKEQLISIPEFSPVGEFQHSSMTNSRALEDLMDLTGSLTCSKLSPEVSISDCNKNLIRGVVSPVSDSKLIGMS
uniref:MAP7 domain containing 2a n=1 Tax=Tetraodon nigroviridis TaxID=99883 RepID=H3CXD1_TETNG